MKKKEYKKKLEKEKKELKKIESMDINSNLKTGIIISVCVIGFILLMFVFTKIKTGEWHLFPSNSKINYKAEAQSEKILCGSILNRSDSEYFVLSYEFKEDSSDLYESLLGIYSNLETKIPIYKVDLSNSRNNICKGETLAITNDVKTLKLTPPSLIKVRNGKIVEHYEKYDLIKKTLSNFSK